MADALSRLSSALAERYRIERELGQGGMATVYLAEDLRYHRRVAIKVLKPELAAVLGADRFVQEITTTAQLQHPHILPLFDSGTADGFLYYVMPYIEGETLRARLDREKQLGVEEAVKITTEVAGALDYAHRHGVIHRDIKPENILLHDGRPVVADFGIALAVSAAAGGRMTETGVSLGTPHYMSPEQATAEREITARSDIYSLGSVLYEMLAGQPPHLGGSAQQIIMKIISEPVQLVTAIRKSVPHNVAAALARALEKLPADRFESAKAFAHALEDPSFGASTLGVGATTQRAGRRWLLIVGVAAGAITGAAIMWLGLRGRIPSNGGVVFTQRTFRQEAIYNARWAADNKTILYTSFQDGVPSVRIIRAEYPEPQPFGPDSAHLLAVSSTDEVALLVHPKYLGQRIFTGTLARMSVAGGAPHELVEDVNEADWSPDGSQLAITRDAGGHDQLEYPIGKVIYSSPPGSYISDLRVSADGGRVGFFLHPVRLDDRGYVAFVDTKGTVTRNEEEFPGLEGLAWGSDDRSILFSAALSATLLEIRRWRPGQAAVKVLPNAGRLTMYDVRAGRWLVSRDDTRWLVIVRPPGAAGVRDISWQDASLLPFMSPDGQMVAFTDQGTLSMPFYAVMVRKSDGSPAVRLGDGWAFALSPDKRWVFGSLPASPPQFRLYPTGAGSFRTLAWPQLAEVYRVTFLPDGRSLYVCGNEANRAGRCYRSALEGGEVVPLTPDSIVGWPLRPDLGAVVASRENKWWIYSLPSGVRRVIPGLTQGPLRWSPDGTELWVFHPGPAGRRGVDRVDVVTGRRTPLFTLGELRGFENAPLYADWVSVADDGRSYAYSTSTYYSLLFSVDGIR